MYFDEVHIFYTFFVQTINLALFEKTNFYHNIFFLGDYQLSSLFLINIPVMNQNFATSDSV